jgi:hypothetical protein
MFFLLPSSFLIITPFQKNGVYWMLRRVTIVRTDASEELSNRRSVRRLLVSAGVVPSSPIPVTVMKEALSSPEASVLTRATLRNISEDTTLHSHRRENLKSYIIPFPLPSIFLFMPSPSPLLPS